ncbi:MAG: hypothetical protein HY066_00755 [Betaproteobacteria bacterium]|nr:hypothetical protein [Betaproteobacteria bacterium]
MPVLLAGSTAEKGYEEQAWGRLLDASGYPRGKATPATPAPAPAPASAR